MTLSAHARGLWLSFCVCECVCYHASCYIPHLYTENKVPLSFLCHFLLMYCVGFAENALFRSSGDICWSLLPFSLLDRISLDKIVSDGFFSRWLVPTCRSSDRSYNSTGWSLDWVNCQVLTWTVLAELCTCDTNVHRVRYMLCNCMHVIQYKYLHSCGYSSSRMHNNCMCCI